MKDFVLETDRLYVRPFKMEDAEEVFVFASNPEINKTTGDPVKTSLAEVRDMITNIWLKEYAQYGYARYAVVHKEDDTIIGFNGIKYIPEIELPELGYRLLPAYWGQGLATESSKAVLDYFYANFPQDRIAAFTYTDNLASINVLKKLGFQDWQQAPYPGETEPLINWYHLNRSDYEG